MNRVLAVVAAVGMVLGAVVLRNWWDGRDDSGGSDEGTLEVVCGTDLAAACAALQRSSENSVRTTVEDEAVTARRLADGSLRLGPHTVWLTAGPWPEVEAAGGTELPPTAASKVLASSPAVLVARSDRMAAVAEHCRTPTWACIGEQAGRPWTELGGEAAWGRVEVGLPAPDTGAGVVTVDQAVASRLGTTDFAVNDLTDDPAASAWFDRLARSSKDNASSTTPLARFLQVPGSLGVVGALESEAAPALAGAAAGKSSTMVVAEPISQAQVRLVGADGDQVGDALDRLGRGALTDALHGTGWRVPDRPAPTGAATMELPSGPGLPSAGTSSAVRTRWEQA